MAVPVPFPDSLNHAKWFSLFFLLFASSDSVPLPLHLGLLFFHNNYACSQAITNSSGGKSPPEQGERQKEHWGRACRLQSGSSGDDLELRLSIGMGRSKKNVCL